MPYGLIGEILVSSDIRKKDITSSVSVVSALHEVREFLVKIQRKLGKEMDCVIEGRDIGSVVFPDADFKVTTVFADGHVEQIGPQEAARLKWTP